MIEGQNVTNVLFHSPRYECRKKNGRMYAYRNKELCLYNISVPDCESGSVVIGGYQYARQQLQERSHNDQCLDYLQFYYHSVSGSLQHTNRTCGEEFVTYYLYPATNFMAVFWLDGSQSYAGFKLRATCQAVDPFNGSGSAGI